MWLSYPILSVVLAHVGGIPTKAYFQAPAAVGALADQEFVLAWDDNDLDPTGKFTFYYQTSNEQPTALITDLGGVTLPNGAQIPIMNVDDQLVWDTSAVPAGSYFVYAITTDPGLPDVFSLSRGTVTVQHAGDPLFPAVVVTEPGASSPPVADRFAVKWEATGDGPLTATVRGKSSNDEAWTDLATDVPMTRGGNVQRGCYLWDLFSATDTVYYEVEVEVKDSAGRTHASYPVTDIAIYRDPQISDAGVPVSCESTYAPDAGPPEPGDLDAGGGDGVDDPEAGGCGCLAGGRPGSAGLAGFALGLLALIAVRRRSR